MSLWSTSLYVSLIYLSLASTSRYKNAPLSKSPFLTSSLFLTSFLPFFHSLSLFLPSSYTITSLPSVSIFFFRFFFIRLSFTSSLYLNLSRKHIPSPMDPSLLWILLSYGSFPSYVWFLLTHLFSYILHSFSSFFILLVSSLVSERVLLSSSIIPLSTFFPFSYLLPYSSAIHVLRYALPRLLNRLLDRLFDRDSRF